MDGHCQTRETLTAQLQEGTDTWEDAVRHALSGDANEEAFTVALVVGGLIKVYRNPARGLCEKAVEKRPKLGDVSIIEWSLRRLESRLRLSKTVQVLKSLLRLLEARPSNAVFWKDLFSQLQAVPGLEQIVLQQLIEECLGRLCDAALDSVWRSDSRGGCRTADDLVDFLLLAARHECAAICDSVFKNMWDTRAELNLLLGYRYRTLGEHIDGHLAEMDHNLYPKYRSFFERFFDCALQNCFSKLGSCEWEEIERSLKHLADPLGTVRRRLRPGVCGSKALRNFGAWIFEKYHCDTAVSPGDDDDLSAIIKLCYIPDMQNGLDTSTIKTIASGILDMPEDIRDFLALSPSFIKLVADVAKGFIRDVLGPRPIMDVSVQALQTVACPSNLLCDVCKEDLAPFFEDPHRREIRIRAKEEVRMHIETLLSRSHSWGVQCDTDRKTCPYTLHICKPESLCDLAAWARKQSSALRLLDCPGDSKSRQEIFGEDYWWIVDTIDGKAVGSASKKRSRSEESVSNPVQPEGARSKKPRFSPR
ncbi:hypothetical protein V5O48_016192 [Marasmius crinis-equi]|uniref:Uncharacterized protein n=1 Tax=Marasmius crinis-equi TaxID=585013 RepID=A0ABR3ESJ0_9AGAR